MNVRQLLPVLMMATAAAAAAQDIEQCRQIADPDARLACFDRITQAPRPAESETEPVPDPAERDLPQASMPEPRASAQVASTIAGVRYREQQKMVFRLANGQIWIQAAPRLLRIREGDAVTIERGSVGGHLLRTADGTTTRVRRLQ